MHIDLTNDEIRESWINELRDLAKLYAHAKSERLQLDEFRKIRRYTLMKQAEQEGYKAIGAQEREAYAHPDYETLINALAAAVEREAKALWEIRIEEMRFEAWRTNQANMRMEKTRYGA